VTIGWKTCENSMPLVFQSDDEAIFSKTIRNNTQ